jgi:hypothetical protein
MASTALDKTTRPMAMRTCLSSEIAGLPRTTGKPAASQASVPPSTFITFNPAVASFSQAWFARLPVLQMT